MVIRPLGSAPASSFIDVLARRLIEAEKELEIAKYRRDLVFFDAMKHGYDRKTVRLRLQRQMEHE